MAKKKFQTYLSEETLKKFENYCSKTNQSKALALEAILLRFFNTPVDTPVDTLTDTPDTDTPIDTLTDTPDTDTPDTDTQIDTQIDKEIELAKYNERSAVAAEFELKLQNFIKSNNEALALRDSEIEALKKQIYELDNQQDRIEREHDCRITSAEADINALGDKLENIQIKGEDTMDYDSSALESEIATLRSEIETIRDEMKTMTHQKPVFKPVAKKENKIDLTKEHIDEIIIKDNLTSPKEVYEYFDSQKIFYQYPKGKGFELLAGKKYEFISQKIQNIVKADGGMVAYINKLRASVKPDTPDTDTQTDTQLDTPDTDTQLDTQLDTQTDTQLDTQLDTQTDTQLDTQTDTQTDTQLDTPDTDTQLDTPDTDTQLDTPDTDTLTDTQLDTKSDTSEEFDNSRLI
jgi:hypothetical protein